MTNQLFEARSVDKPSSRGPNDPEPYEDMAAMLSEVHNLQKGSRVTQVLRLLHLIH